MKRKLLVLAFALLLLVGAGLWLELGKRSPPSPDTDMGSPTTSASNSSANLGPTLQRAPAVQNHSGGNEKAPNAGAVGVLRHTNNATMPSGAGPSVPTDVAKLREQKARAWISQKNGKIDFWGKVVDQDESPLGEVSVMMSVRQWRLLPPGADYPKFSTKTDAAGNFRFLNVTGDTMTIETVAKEGYSLSPEDKRRAIAYPYHGLAVTFVPNADQPEVFRLRKQKGAEPMIHHERGRYAIRVDGTPIQFDLRTGKKVANGGDFTIALIRDPETVVPAAGKSRYYSWRLILSAPGGGVIFRRDHFGYEAPADGYLESVETGQTTDDPKWSQYWNGEIYCRNRAGQFCRLLVVAGTAGPADACLTGFECFLNPSGSRNLEFDSRLKIIPSLNPAQ